MLDVMKLKMQNDDQVSTLVYSCLLHGVSVSDIQAISTIEFHEKLLIALLKNKNNFPW